MKPSILIIDDEAIILQTLTIMFKRAGVAADTESDPAKAIVRFADGGYNIALVDVLMPQISGLEVIAALKKQNPLCNVIVMTAFSTMERVVECIEAGACDYVTKPFGDVSVLMAVVRSALERVERWHKSFGIELDRPKRSSTNEP